MLQGVLKTVIQGRVDRNNLRDSLRQQYTYYIPSDIGFRVRLPAELKRLTNNRVR